jgi:ADP-ribosylglycohydrolase
VQFTSSRAMRDDYKQAMVENVMAGGDSSARGILAGMILGAAHGMTAIPETWVAGMTAGQRIRQPAAKGLTGA